MKRYLKYLVLVSLVTISCQKILFNHDEEKRELDFENFHFVKISGIYNIVLIQDSLNQLVITGKNDINTIDAYTDSDTLYINDRQKVHFNPARTTLTLHFSDIEYMRTIDPVNITSPDTIKATMFLYETVGEIAEIRLTVDCSFLYAVNSSNTLGSFYFNGKADYCKFINRYGSNIFADSISCKYADITNESIGDIHINASAEIKAYIRGSGNIYYYGTPSVKVEEKTGKGEIFRIN
jgi:hypothetical protein